jgi:hypothetical protein
MRTNRAQTQDDPSYPGGRSLASPPRPDRTARRLLKPTTALVQPEEINVKRSLFCRMASARRWMVTASALAVLAGSAGTSRALARSRDQVGDIVSRPAVQLPETALTTIQHSRETVRQRLDAIAAQADPLADALDKYKKNPSPQTAIQLLHREAVVAGIGASESEKIAAEAGTVARTCAELAAQCGRQIEMLGGDAAKASRAQAEYDTARNVGLGELRDLHRSLVERGATNDALIPPAERRNISRLLQLYGAADLAERFVRMEANANQAVLGKLQEMGDQFAARQHDFEDLSAAYRLHAQSFQTVGGSVGRVAHLIEVSQRFDAESQSAAQLQQELGHIDDVLAKTFDSLPDDLSPVFAPSHTPQTPAVNGGIWNRLLRLLGMDATAKSDTANVSTTN